MHPAMDSNDLGEASKRAAVWTDSTLATNSHSIINASRQEFPNLHIIADTEAASKKIMD